MGLVTSKRYSKSSQKTESNSQDKTEDSSTPGHSSDQENTLEHVRHYIGDFEHIDDAIYHLGKPLRTYRNSDPFVARSYDEDVFLMCGGRWKFYQRMEFRNGDHIATIYVNEAGEIVKFFD